MDGLIMVEEITSASEWIQWAADNNKLLIAGLSDALEINNPLSYDELTVETVLVRCQKRLGQEVGLQLFQSMLATLPDRYPELFPELVGFETKP
jgi:hypothetical protein